MNYVLPAASAGQAFRRDERISVEIKARDRSRIGDSAPQYCGATKRSAERRRRRQDDVFQQPPKGRDYTEGGGHLNGAGYEAVVNVVRAHVMGGSGYCPPTN